MLIVAIHLIGKALILHPGQSQLRLDSCWCTIKGLQTNIYWKSPGTDIKIRKSDIPSWKRLVMQQSKAPAHSRGFFFFSPRVNVSTAINNLHNYWFLCIALWQARLSQVAEEPPLAEGQTQAGIHANRLRGHTKICQTGARRRAGFTSAHVLVAQVI